MPNVIVRASATAVPNSQPPRRGFLRQLCGLPLLGGRLSLIGAPTAVAEPVTLALIAAYDRWLTMEHSMLRREMPPPSWDDCLPKRPSMAGWRADQVAEYLGAEQRIRDIHAEIRATARDYRLQATVWGQRFHDSPIDKFYLAPDLAVICPPASTRAALVLSAVGCDWRA